MKDEAFYEAVFNEIENGEIRKGIWAKAFSISDGDLNKTKSEYIKIRVLELKKEIKSHAFISNKGLLISENEKAFIDEAKRAGAEKSYGSFKYWYQSIYKGSFRVDEKDYMELINKIRNCSF